MLRDAGCCPTARRACWRSSRHRRDWLPTCGSFMESLTWKTSWWPGSRRPAAKTPASSLSARARLITHSGWRVVGGARDRRTVNGGWRQRPVGEPDGRRQRPWSRRYEGAIDTLGNGWMAPTTRWGVPGHANPNPRPSRRLRPPSACQDGLPGGQGDDNARPSARQEAIVCSLDTFCLHVHD